MNAAPVHGEDGETLGGAGVTWDSTEQRQAEEALSYTSQHVSEVLESISDGFYALDREWRLTYVNRKAAASLGLTPGELIGRPFWESYPHLLGSELEARFHQALQEGEPQFFEMQVGATDRWHHLRVYPSREGISIYFQDITDRRRRDGNAAFLAEISDDLARLSSPRAIVRTVGAKLAHYLRASHCAFSEVDEAQDHVTVECAWRAGGPPHAIVGHRLSECLTKEVRRAARAGDAIIARRAQSGSPADAEHCPTFHLHAHIAVPFHRRGEWKYLLSVGAPATRDWREDEVDLLREVASRTFPRLERARAEGALLAAQRARAELAEHLNDEIAHRVKNHLAMLSGLLHMQALRQGDPEVAEALRDSVARVRTFAALHEQMYQGPSEQVELPRAVRAIAEMNRSIFGRTEDVVLSVTGTEIRCSSRHATNLAVMANELITNALRHGGPGPDGARLLRLRLQEEEGNLVLEVWNSGPSLPPDFDPAAGSGMGLLLVSELVESYAGRFLLASHDGGTLARVELSAAELGLPSSTAPPEDPPLPNA